MSNKSTKVVFNMILAVTFFSASVVARAELHEGHHSHEQQKAATPAHCEDTSEADKATIIKLRPLAAIGDAKAQFELGFMYERGRGVQQNYTEAAAWYRKAAEQGNASAQFYLGQMYDIGKGVQQDYTEAAAWYRKAAEQSETLAQIHLGFLYEHGQGVSVDIVQAYKWYSLAALSSNEIAPRIKKAAENKMTKSELKEARNLTDAWLAQQK